MRDLIYIYSSGMPQESVLGPLFFILYLSDFGKILSNCKYHFYAGVVIYFCGTKMFLQEAVQKINDEHCLPSI